MWGMKASVSDSIFRCLNPFLLTYSAILIIVTYMAQTPLGDAIAIKTKIRIGIEPLKQAGVYI